MRIPMGLSPTFGQQELRGMTRAITLATPTLAAITTLACAGEKAPPGPPATGPELVEASIAYHDPDGAWSSFSHGLVIEQRRPDGSLRTVRVHLDVPGGGFHYEEEATEGLVEKGMSADGCFATVNGESPTDEQTADLRLDCPAIERTRNYHLYLWGLPMKLRDPGTNIDAAITDSELDGRPTRVVKVTYDPEVGTDVWYFHFHPETHRMVGYRFDHDVTTGRGEYIFLGEDRDVLGMKIPAERRWFTNLGDRYLGTDVLVDDFAGKPAG